MSKSKTFNLVNEERNRKFEKLYDPKGCWWMRYIVIPALIGFVLFLVFMNVDFSAHKHTTTSVTASPSYSTEITETGRRARTITTKSESCNIVGYDNCNLVCYGGFVQDLKAELERRQTNCGENVPLQVLIRSYASTNNTLKRKDLDGNFKIYSLTLESNYGIKTIEDQAFNSPSMEFLTKLELRNPQVATLNKYTFLGLKSLIFFSMTQILANFNGDGFLQPLAKTLQNITIATQKKAIYDPTFWFQGDNFKSLSYVDLSTSKFAHTLRKETFEKLISVKALYLKNCDITSIADGTFVSIANTLETLDLSDNQLVTLDVSFLQSIHGTLRLKLGANSWDCSCENFPIIEAFNDDPIIEYSADEPPMCTAPPKDKKKLFTEIYLSLQVECTITTTTVVSTSETNSLKSTTPSEIEPDAESTESTDTTSTTGITFDPFPPTVVTLFPPSTPIPTPLPTPPTTVVTPGTPITPSPPPFPPAPLVTLHCKTHSLHSGESQSSDLKIPNYDALFSIVTETQNSVKVTIHSKNTALSLIFFTPKSNTFKNISLVIRDDSTENQNEIITTLVHGLSLGQLYVFCLMPDLETAFETTPLNCLSHIWTAVELPKSIWLSKTDLAWALPVLIIGILLSLCCGIAVIYFLLHWRPTWLRGSKRIRRKNSDSFEVYLMPKEAKEHTSAVMDSAYNKLDLESYNYMQYYKDSPDSQQIRTIHSSIHIAPHEAAPSIPNRGQNSDRSVSSSIHSNEFMELREEEENDYQSINYYELIL